MNEEEVMELVERWGTASAEEVASRYERWELEGMFYAIYKQSPSKSIYKTGTSIVTQLRSRRATMKRAKAFTHVATPATTTTPVTTVSSPLEKMSLSSSRSNAPKEVNFQVLYNTKDGKQVGRIIKGTTMGSVVQRLEESGCVVYFATRETL